MVTKELLMLIAIISGFNFIIDSGNCSNNSNTRFLLTTNLTVIYEEDGEYEKDENNNNENVKSSIQENANNNDNLNISNSNNNTYNNYYIDMEIEDHDFYNIGNFDHHYVDMEIESPDFY